MEQTLHILKKDIRHLRKEILLMWVMAAVFALTHTRFPYPTWIPVLLLAVYLIARAVHDESIPGENQFWLTRPYRRHSLLAAKLMFVLLCVHLPVFLAQLSIFLRAGFPLAGNLAGILWSQFLLAFAGALPIVAMAAMTGGLTTFVLWSILVTGVVGSILQNFLIDTTWPGSLEWMRYAILVIVLIASAITVIGLQYSRRGTVPSRWIGATSVVAALLAAWYLPLSAAMPVQAAFSGHLDTSGIRLAAGPRLAVSTDTIRATADRVSFDLELELEGLPDGVEIDAHKVVVELERPGGQVLRPEVRRIGRRQHSLDVQLFVPEGIRDERVRVRGSVALTLWSPGEQRTVRPGPAPTAVRDGIDCTDAGPSEPWRGRVTVLVCRSPFRFPALQIKDDSEGWSRSYSTLSPFPSGIDMNQRVEWAYWRDASVPADAEVRFGFLEPAAHLYREFETLADLSEAIR